MELFASIYFTTYASGRHRQRLPQNAAHLGSVDTIVGKKRTETNLLAADLVLSSPDSRVLKAEILRVMAGLRILELYALGIVRSPTDHG